MGIKGIMPTKNCKCIKCGINLYNVHNYTKYCLDCRKIADKEKTKRHKTKNKERYSLYSKNYKKEHPDKKRESDKRYREKHKEELKIRRIDYDNKYYDTLKGKINLHNGRIKRREKINNISHLFSYDDWLKKLKDTNGYCPKCKEYIGIDNLTLDHIIPISKVEVGHVYSINDIQPLCKSCNCSKGDKL
jgi:5-methylcytosine-specific restriction endonuclease McrA